jgi:hypothetical protein
MRVPGGMVCVSMLCSARARRDDLIAWFYFPQAPRRHKIHKQLRLEIFGLLGGGLALAGDVCAHQPLSIRIGSQQE